MYSKDDGIQRSEQEKYDNDSQVDGYAYALSKKYPGKAMGVIVDIALVHNTEHNVFIRRYVKSYSPTANDWLPDVIHWTQQIMQAGETGFYSKSSPGACKTIYGVCEYKSICSLYSPSNEAPEIVPDKFRFEQWEPFDFDELRRSITNNGETS